MAQNPKLRNKDYGRMYVFHLSPNGFFANINKLTIKAVTKRSLKPTNQVSYNIISRIEVEDLIQSFKIISYYYKYLLEVFSKKCFFVKNC